MIVVTTTVYLLYSHKTLLFYFDYENVLASKKRNPASCQASFYLFFLNAEKVIAAPVALRSCGLLVPPAFAVRYQCCGAALPGRFGCCAGLFAVVLFYG